MGAKIYNSNLTKEIIEGARLQQQQGSIPQELAEKVIPVMEVNPKLLRSCNIVYGTVNGANGATTIYTTPTDKDFYLVAANLNNTSDAACDNTNIQLVVTTENGVSEQLIYLTKISLTAFNDSISLSLPIPLKLKRNSTITIEQTFTVGVSRSGGSIVGYTVDNITA